MESLTLKNNSYLLVDSGEGRKLEKVGPYYIIRPASCAFWRPILKDSWQLASATFERKIKNRWLFKEKLPTSWKVNMDGIYLKVILTPFGHIGFFPEHLILWKYLREKISQSKRKLNVLNLFAYSGGATLFAAKEGASVCHVDASHPMVKLATENAALNGLKSASLRWIVDDIFKFLRREVRRGTRYDAIILDPPTFGRGTRKEVFKVERDILDLLDLCKKLLFGKTSFLVLSSHTLTFTPTVLRNLLMQTLGKGSVVAGELFVSSRHSFRLPAGVFARWEGG